MQLLGLVAEGQVVVPELWPPHIVICDRLERACLAKDCLVVGDGVRQRERHAVPARGHDDKVTCLLVCLKVLLQAELLLELRQLLLEEHVGRRLVELEGLACLDRDALHLILGQQQPAPRAMDEHVVEGQAVLCMQLVARARGPEDKVAVGDAAGLGLPLLRALAQDAPQLAASSGQQPTAELCLRRQGVPELREDGELLELRGVPHEALGVDDLLAVLRVLARQLGLCGRAVEADHEVPREGHQLRLLHLQHVAHEARARLVRRPVFQPRHALEVLVRHDARGRPVPPDPVPVPVLEECRGVGHQQRLRKVHVLALLQPPAELLGRNSLHRDLLRLELGHRLHAILRRREVLGNLSELLLLHHFGRIEDLLQLLHCVVQETDDVALELLLLRVG
mmetsp:Transcript_78769/g.255202  ORF Transcript_78769/g.255202 Transcript_78769/m.255202 type:complete len:395 (+) Transcript_78769:931-2115(+)